MQIRSLAFIVEWICGVTFNMALLVEFRKSRNVVRYLIKPIIFLVLFSGALDLIIGILTEDLGPDPHKTLLLTTGIWGLNSLMVTLAITPVSNWLNWPLLMTARRMTGLLVFFYASAHFWIFIQFILDFDWTVLLSEIIKRPYITIGFISWLLLIPLAVTSTKGMVKRLGKSWKKLHKLVYLIGILAVWHFTWQVKLDLTEPVIYIVILVVLLGWRDLNDKRKKARKASKLQN
jgi:sulfoxide reductase heme-binding subunit YedZ